MEYFINIERYFAVDHLPPSVSEDGMLGLRSEIPGKLGFVSRMVRLKPPGQWHTNASPFFVPAGGIEPTAGNGNTIP